MKKFVLSIFNGGEYIINEEEYKNILNGGDTVMVKRLLLTFTKKSPYTIMPYETYLLNKKKENKSKQNIGILHDGTRVKKYFGEWVVDDGGIVNDNGNYQPVKLDPKYYPEVARDCVPTIEEFDEIKKLPNNERLDLILKNTNPLRLKEEGIKSVGEVLKNKE